MGRRQAKFAPRAEEANSPEDFYRVLRDLSFYPGWPCELELESEVFSIKTQGGGFGLVLVELSDGRAIAKEVLPNSVAEKAGLVTGGQMFEWDSQPVSEAIQAVIPGFGPYSTDHARRVNQVSFLTRVPRPGQASRSA